MNWTSRMTAVCVLLAVVLPAQAALDVPLTVTERAGFARAGEPVTSGVPLPQGLTEDVAKLTLLGPDGKAVPAQFTVANRWFPGNSVKWVLVDFHASVPANGKAVYRLTDGGQNVAPAQRVAVELKDGVATVTTGAIKFAVKQKGFNLLDGVWLDPAGKGDYKVELLAPGKADIRLFHGGSGLPAYKSFSPSADEAVTLSVEESGPMRAVLKLTGKHLSTDEMAGDNHLLDFVCRITAYAGSGLVKVDYSLECKQGKSISEGLPLDRFWFSLPLSLEAASTSWAVGVGDGKALHPGSDEKDLPAWDETWEKPAEEVAKYFKPGLDGNCITMSEGSDRITFRGDFFRKRHELIVAGKREKARSLTAGWMDQSDANKGMAAGIRWFWQTYPRVIKAEGTAMIVMPHGSLAGRLPLLTRPHGPRAYYYPGMSKTTEVLLHFHGPRDLGRIVAVQVGLQSPLRAWAEPSWYCEKTQAFGRLASSDKALYDDAAHAAVAQYDTNVRATLDRILAHRDKQWGGYDSYGMFNFGDTIDFISGQRGDPDDINVSWDNGYYDYPHALFLQWARTGDPDYFELAEQAQHHLMDLDMMCWDPDPKMLGANRYCDGTMHLRMQKGIYRSDTFNHYKNGSHFERFYLTGFRRALDMGVVSAQFPLNTHGIGFGEPRSLGHGPLGCLNAYQATGEKKYLDRFVHFEKWYMDAVAKGSRIAKGRHWQGGIGLEGMRQYYEFTGDPRGLESLTVQVDACHALKDHADSALHAFAFLGAQLDRPELSKVAFGRIARAGDIKRDWGYGQSFGNQLRNAPYVFWYMTKDLPKKLQVQPMKLD